MENYNIKVLTKTSVLPNKWDIFALLFIISLITVFAWGALQMVAPYQIGDKIRISLDPSNLPHYALRTVLRILLALLASLIFTFIIGTWAAKSKKAESIIIPLIDTLQSVPVLSFLSIAFVFLIALFPNSLLGPEIASIFATFTAQVWNMVFGLYQSIKTLPKDLKDVSYVFRLSRWQTFWRIEVPYSMSSFLWNTMASTSASWFFAVASEAITISNQEIQLPGIGSYIAVAIKQSNVTAVIYAIITMFIVIVLYDQILFRPLMQWAEKFKTESIISDKSSRSWVITLLQRSKISKKIGFILSNLCNLILQLPILKFNFTIINKTSLSFLGRIIWSLSTTILIIGCIYVIFNYLLTAIDLKEIILVSKLGLISAIKVNLLVIICALIWTPIGVWIGMRSHLAHTIQPIIQFIAAFPANVLFPFVVICIVKYKLNVDLWTAPLMILGSQWYILFNVIAGTMNLPKELHYVTACFRVTRLQWWFKFVLPGIFPFLTTGAITAAGGAWNATIVAECVKWGDVTLIANGLGSYIVQHTVAGDFHRIALGTTIMCIYVVILNKILWRPLYNLAETKFKF